jgi:hypothetical protein
MEGLGKLKKPVASGIEHATFGFVEFFVFEHWRVESKLGPLGTAATTSLLYLPRVIVTMEKLVG